MLALFQRARPDFCGNVRDIQCSSLPVQKNWLYIILVVGGIILAAMLAYSILGWTGMR